MMKNTIKVGDKSYEKSLRFGNRKLQVVAKSRKVYTRKPKHKGFQEV
jgi:hypothetical protein